MKTPTLHLNGTSGQELREQLALAVEAIVRAQEKLMQAMPHGRDYYPQGNDAIFQAQSEMRARDTKLEQVKQELVLMHQAVADQEREQRRR